ncbi:hypothetical protein [Micromonospora sp. DT31]|uniref:hypothetical protein n=1 Tax=Micromonospora sp. DT31 TaxID=3393434 RepID=UPI003CEE63E6
MTQPADQGYALQTYPPQGTDLEGQQQISLARAASAWTRQHINSNSIADDVILVATSSTAFATAINDFAFQSQTGGRVIELTNAATNLGTGVVELLTKSEQRDNPAFVVSTLASGAISVARAVVDFALNKDEVTQKNVQFGLTLAQMALQVCKWATKPSVAKAMGKEAAKALRPLATSVENDVQSATRAVGAFSAPQRRATAPASSSRRSPDRSPGQASSSMGPGDRPSHEGLRHRSDKGKGKERRR